jgi:hypothetical protein
MLITIVSRHDGEAKQDAWEGLYVTAHSLSACSDRSLLPSRRSAHTVRKISQI